MKGEKMATLKAPFALDRSLNTTESPSRNIADVLAEELSAMITAIGGLNFINFVVVAELPTTGISTTTIYLVPSDDPQSENTYDEYINLNGTVSGWEKIGSTDIDLSGYYTSAEVDDLLADKADVSDIPTVNDGTLTIQQNGDTKGTFTANQSGNSTVNIEIPTTDIQTAVDEFETYNGGLLSECIIELVPVQSGSGDPSPDNVRPISGHTQVVVGDDGKNLFKNTLTDGTTDGTTWKVKDDESIEISGTAAANVYVNISDIELEAGTYTASSGSSGSWSTSGIYVRNVTDSTTINMIESENGLTFTLTEKKTIRLVLYVANGQTVNKTFYPMIRLASDTDPTYVPYNGYQVTVNLGGTYYSGTLDVVTGIFTARTAFKTFDGSEGWVASDTRGYVIIRSQSGMSDVKLATSANTYCLSNLFPKSGVTWTDKAIGIDNGTVWIGDDGNAVFGDLAGFKSFLSNTNLQLEYELATPLTIQLSPTMVKALVGENHLSAPLEGQEITESKYKQTFTFDDVIAYIQSLS